MQIKRFRLILSIAVMLALLAGSLPTTFSMAMENSQAGKPGCPPIDSSLAENPAFVKSLPPKCRAESHRTNSSQQRALPQALLLATGGPDNFGYTYDDTVPFNWISATAGGLTGGDGLGYQSGDTGLSAPKAIRFYYSTGSIARVAVSPLNAGKFAGTSGHTDFPVSITNTGTAGTDTYNLSLASAWPVNLYQDGCVTPLTDTNADTVIDTGPLPESSSTTICVSFSTPGGSGIGDNNSGVLSVSSSLDSAKTKEATLSMVIPAPFVQVFEDYENAAMAFQFDGPAGPTTNYVTSDLYFANGPATMRMPDGRYLYAWRKPDGNYPDSHSNIEFTILNPDGSSNVPVTQLTNNAGAGQTYDYAPTVAVAPNGNIGITWYRWLVDNNTGLSNYNIYFAMLSGNGTVLFAPNKVTNNDLYDNFDNLDVPHYFSPAIAATSDNRFILSWQDYRSDGVNIFNNNIWFSGRNTNGTNVLNPTMLTSDGTSVHPVLNPLSGNDVILSYVSNLNVSYFIVSSNGTVSISQAVPNGSSYQSTDAVMLPNGLTALAWTTTSQDVGYVMLDAAHTITVGPIFATNVYAKFNRDLSVTYDTSNNIIMTWSDDEAVPSTKLFYALADSAGAFITNPAQFRLSTPGVITSENGQGNAPVLSAPQAMEVGIDVLPGVQVNRISSQLRFVPVAILSTQGFNAPRDVNRTSLTFGKTGDEVSLLYCLKKGVDVNHDRKRDLVCFFRIRKTGLVAGDRVAVLKGSTITGIALEGSDTVKILKPPKHK